MTLDEAIAHCEQKAKELRELPLKQRMDLVELADCEQCAEEHEQLAAWLKELKVLRDVHGKVYRNEECDRAGKCYDYIGYHCAGCNGVKENKDEV